MGRKYTDQDRVSARYWCGILYPENMIPNWEEVIGDYIELPYAYCIHDKDLTNDPDEIRKVHIHLVVCFPNTTTNKAVLNLMRSLSDEGKNCISTVEQVLSIRHIYEYLIHNTETCKKQGKYLYPASARITGNNFDIGAYEQLSTQEKMDMAKDIANYIVSEGIEDFMELFLAVDSNFENSYFEILKNNASFFSYLCKGVWLRKHYN